MPMLDYGTLPPEINSTRMYSGPGSGPMMAAAAAWDTLASGLDSLSRRYSSVISRLQGESWSGGASSAMASAVAPYVAWATMAGAQAEQTAGQARAAAAAYETALAATVPPAQVTGNRTQLATLVATNIFGQNTMMIAATEAAYEEMWAQDAAAMYGYAASSSAATTLTQFSQPPQTTNASGQSAQTAAVAQATGTSTAGQAQTTLSQLMSTVPQQLQTLSAAGSSGSSASSASSILTGFSSFNTLAGPAGLVSNFSRTTTSMGSFLSGTYRSGIQSIKDAANAATAAATTGAATLGSGGVPGSVVPSVGNAALVGKLSVPQSWATANPVVRAADEPVWLSDADLDGGPSWGESPAMFTGAPTAGTGTTASMFARPTVSNVLRVGSRRFKMPRPSVGG